jgi:hypothetical protein
MTNNKAREINSPVIKQLIDETTPEELAKIDAEMTNNKELTSNHFDNQKTENINNKQQSSVEWLHDELFKSFQKFYTLQFTMEEYQANNVKLYLQAKEMEKERMIEFTNEWFEEYQCGLDNFKNPEQYYNETYGGDEK